MRRVTEQQWKRLDATPDEMRLGRKIVRAANPDLFTYSGQKADEAAPGELYDVVTLLVKERRAKADTCSLPPGAVEFGCAPSEEGHHMRMQLKQRTGSFSLLFNRDEVQRLAMVLLNMVPILKTAPPASALEKKSRTIA